MKIKIIISIVFALLIGVGAYMFLSKSSPRDVCKNLKADEICVCTDDIPVSTCGVEKRVSPMNQIIEDDEAQPTAFPPIDETRSTSDIYASTSIQLPPLEKDSNTTEPNPRDVCKNLKADEICVCTDDIPVSTCGVEKKLNPEP